METGALGKVYQDGEVIVRQGEMGDCMYVIQEGLVEIIAEEGEKEVQLAVRNAGEFFGEMAIFEREVRSATVRALGDARVLTVDERNFLRRIHQDPSLAYRMVQTMSRRIRELSAEVARLKGN
ncbi:MAG TPA: cyclic nucleotide-binding domain-containing protein [Anaerolineales bacterium]|nr:cyclic nucleotide-binding domain-containing protein [Anaerolineales bacterium]